MTTNFQDTFLSTIRKEKIPVTIFLTNGYQIRCTIHAYDNYVLIVAAERRQQMVYKHAISTIAPSNPVRRQHNAGPETALETPETQETPEVEA